MARSVSPSVLTDPILARVARWSIATACLAAAVGLAFTGDVRMPVSCLIGAAFDIGTAEWVLAHAHARGATGGLADTSFMSLFALRLLGKALLLVCAALLPAWLDVVGMAAGVLVVEFTLATAGAFVAAVSAFRPGRPTT